MEIFLNLSCVHFFFICATTAHLISKQINTIWNFTDELKNLKKKIVCSSNLPRWKGKNVTILNIDSNISWNLLGKKWDVMKIDEIPF